MKFRMTLLVFRDNDSQGELDVIAEYPDAIAALNAVAQLAAVNSRLSSHPLVKALLMDLSPKALARLNETMGEHVVIQIKEITEYSEVMPEALRRNPHAFHIIASRPVRKIPPEGLITAPDNITMH